MSISNYGQLKTSVALYLNRSDLTTYIPDFITLCVNRLNFGGEAPFLSKPLRIPAMQSQDTGAISGNAIAFPTGFLEMIRLAATSNGVTWTLDYIDPSGMSEKSSSSGLPTVYTYLNNSVQTAGTGSATYVMDYYEAFAAFSGDSDTNWVLTNSPNVYLYGSLLESAPFLLDDQRVQGWYGMFVSAVNALNRSMKRHGTAPQARVMM